MSDRGAATVLAGSGLVLLVALAAGGSWAAAAATVAAVIAPPLLLLLPGRGRRRPWLATALAACLAAGAWVALGEPPRAVGWVLLVLCGLPWLVGGLGFALQRREGEER